MHSPINTHAGIWSLINTHTLGRTSHRNTGAYSMNYFKISLVNKLE